MVGHAGVAVRRAAPHVAFALAGGLVLFLLLTPELGGTAAAPFSAVLVPSVLVFPVALYSVAAWSSHSASLLALAASVAGGVLSLVRLWGADYLTVAQPGLASPEDPVESWPLFLLLGVVAMVLAPWCAGRYRRLRTLYVAELEERARRAQEDRAAEALRAVEQERRRIAREMHDVVAHSLSVMVSQAEGGRMMAARDPASTAPVLDNIARAGREAMQDMRGVLHVLRQDSEDDETRQPRPALADLPDLVATVRSSGLPVCLEERGDRQRMSAAAELAAYRITQEALTNVLKHAGSDASTTVLLAWRPDALDLRVCNRVEERRGNDVAAASGTGSGLRGMDDRLTALGGSLRVTSHDGRFSVAASIPTAVRDGRR
jgi:signal transduction histidine kinase